MRAMSAAPPERPSTDRKPDDLQFLAALRSLERAPAPFEAALERTLAHFRAESGTIHRLVDGMLELRAHARGMPPPVVELIRRIPIGKGMAGLAVERGEPVTACNLQTDTSGDVRPGARATGLKGSIVVPMLAGSRPVGTLGIGNQAERTFTPAEVELLLAAAGVLAGWRDAAAAS
jgi:GAF domain-containing protein